MKMISNINLPQKSIFGFKVLSSLHSSIACYILLFIGKFLNPFFGYSQIQLIAGSFFNIVLNVSIVILILNLLIKRNKATNISLLFDYNRSLVKRITSEIKRQKSSKR